MVYYIFNQRKKYLLLNLRYPPPPLVKEILKKQKKSINSLDLLVYLMNYKQDLIKALKKLNLFAKTNFIILFGSVSKGRANPLSDIDLCISLDLPLKERLQARIKLSGILPEKYDLQLFEDLPVYVQKSVLSGKVLYNKNQQQLIEKAIDVINEYDDFKKVYDYYLAKDKMAVEI